MKDFMLLIRSPKEIFCKERENTSIIITVLIFLVTASISAWRTLIFAENTQVTELLKKANISTMTNLPIAVVSICISLVIGVSILTVIMRTFVKGVDQIIVEKKNTKKLVYLAVLLPQIVTNIFNIIFYFSAKTMQPSYLSGMTSIYEAIVTAMLLYLILARVVKAEKSANIFPMLYILFHIITSLKSIMA